MREFLFSIPTVLWSVVIGSGITLFGVFLSNISQNNRLKIQLSHEKEQRDLERKASLRKVVYLEFVEEQTKAFGFLGTLAGGEVTTINMNKDLGGFLEASAKLNMIAKNNTCIKLGLLTSAYNKILFRALPIAASISIIKNDIKLNNEFHNEVDIERKRILAAMTAHNESLTKDSSFSALGNSFDDAQQRAQTLTEKLNAFYVELNKEVNELISFVMGEMKELVPLQASLMIAIRDEMDIETDIGSYKKMIEENSELVSTEINNLIETIEKNKAD